MTIKDSDISEALERLRTIFQDGVIKSAASLYRCLDILCVEYVPNKS